MACPSFIKILLSVTVITVMASCLNKNDETQLPANILNEEEFTKVIVDFALAESTSNINVKNLPADKMDSLYTFNPLTENNVSKSQYDSTITFYSKHPALYKKVYDNVLEELSKMQIKTDSAKVDPAVK
ncbi:MAG: DUF4296 domain-containing protein [Bacteroidetes bacterium]|nr:DUF4296 domain-containing protein [Bacteroidota bacterium]